MPARNERSRHGLAVISAILLLLSAGFTGAADLRSENEELRAQQLYEKGQQALEESAFSAMAKSKARSITPALASMSSTTGICAPATRSVPILVLFVFSYTSSLNPMGGAHLRGVGIPACAQLIRFGKHGSARARPAAEEATSGFIVAAEWDAADGHLEVL